MALSYVRLIWRALDVVADSADPGAEPDSRPLPDGTVVTITPTPGMIIDATERPAVTYYPQSIPCSLDAQGNLIDAQGNLGLLIIDPTDESLQPNNWTINVQVRAPGAQARSWAIKLTVPEPADPDNPDLVTYDITRNGPVPQYTGSATTASEYAAQASAYAQAAATAAASVTSGEAGGLATLDDDGKVPLAQIPSLTADLLPDLSGTYTTPAAVTQEVADQIAASAPFDVRKFGAKGDGVTDDWQAISDAVDAAYAASNNFDNPNGSMGASVIFPTGVYMVSKPVPIWNNISYVGVAAGIYCPASCIRMMANASDTRAVMADNHWLAGSNERSFNVTIENLGLDGNEVATYGLVDQTRWGRFVGLSIRQTTSHGIYLPATDLPTHEEQFINCEVVQVDGNAFEAEANRFDSNIFQLHSGPSLNAIHLAMGNGWLISECHPFGIKESGIVVDSAGTTKIINNYIDGPGAGTSPNTRYGVKIGAVASQTMVTGNMVYTKGSTAPIVAYYARGSSGVLFMKDNSTDTVAGNNLTISDVADLHPASIVKNNALSSAAGYMDHTEVVAAAGSVTSDASGFITIPHKLGQKPAGAEAWMDDTFAGQHNFLMYRPSGSTATSLSFTLRKISDQSANPNVAVNVYYRAWT